MSFQSEKAKCAAKHRYDSEDDAQRQADWLMKYETKRELRTYRCIYCRGFHLTSVRSGNRYGADRD